MKANICVVVFDGVSYVDEDFCVNLTQSKVSTGLEKMKL